MLIGIECTTKLEEVRGRMRIDEGTIANRDIKRLYVQDSVIVLAQCENLSLRSGKGQERSVLGTCVLAKDMIHT